MSAHLLCEACIQGDHDNHDGKHHGLPGVLGGHSCMCPGGCEPRPIPFLDMFREDHPA